MKLASRKAKLDHKISTRKNFWIHEITTRNRLGPTKLPREKFLEHETSTSKNFGPIKYPNKKFYTHKYPRQNMVEPKTETTSITEASEQDTSRKARLARRGLYFGHSP